MTIEDVKKAYTDVFALPDDRVLELALAVVVNMYVKTDPIWLLLVGAPSSGKSEIIQAFYKIPKVYEVSDITENSFLSGAASADGGSSSFLHQIGAFGTIAMKDFTSILSYRSEKRETIMAQMRQIYDGYMTKKTGRVKVQPWKGKINLLGGVTEDIYTKDDESASMGRRSILYQLPDQDPFAMMDAAVKSRRGTAISVSRERIQDMFAQYVSDIVEKIGDEPLPDTEESVKQSLKILSNFATHARTPVNRDRFSHDITYIHKREMPVRFFEQLHTFAETLQYLHNGSLSPSSLEPLYKIAFDSIPTIRRRVLFLLTEYSKITTKAAALKLGLTTMTVRRVLEDLNALKMVVRLGGGQGQKDWWSMDASFCDIIEQYAYIARQGGDLDTVGEDLDEGEAYEAAQGADTTFNTL